MDVLSRAGWTGAQQLKFHVGLLPTSIDCWIVSPNGRRARTRALLDTGAAFSVVEERELDGVAGEPLRRPLSSRLGPVTGRLCPVRVDVVAHAGADLRVDARLVVADDWRGPTILGVTGFLEHVRIGLFPARTAADPAWFCFGVA